MFVGNTKRCVGLCSCPSWTGTFAYTGGQFEHESNRKSTHLAVHHELVPQLVKWNLVVQRQFVVPLFLSSNLASAKRCNKSKSVPCSAMASSSRCAILCHHHRIVQAYKCSKGLTWQKKISHDFLLVVDPRRRVLQAWR